MFFNLPELSLELGFILELDTLTCCMAVEGYTPTNEPVMYKCILGNRKRRIQGILHVDPSFPPINVNAMLQFELGCSS